MVAECPLRWEQRLEGRAEPQSPRPQGLGQDLAQSRGHGLFTQQTNLTSTCAEHPPLTRGAGRSVLEPRACALEKVQFFKFKDSSNFRANTGTPKV